MYTHTHTHMRMYVRVHARTLQRIKSPNFYHDGWTKMVISYWSLRQHSLIWNPLSSTLSGMLSRKIHFTDRIKLRMHVILDLSPPSQWWPVFFIEKLLGEIFSAHLTDDFLTSFALLESLERCLLDFLCCQNILQVEADHQFSFSVKTHNLCLKV